MSTTGEAASEDRVDDVEGLVGDRDEALVVRDHGAIRFIVLNNPARRNALNEDIRRGLAERLAEVSSSEAVRVVILTGRGGAFSSGFDLSELRRPGGPAIVRPDPGEAVRRAGRPVIAAVDGACMTGGLELALSASFILASDRAVFADTHARVGIFPAWGMSALLPRAVGIRRARQMSLSGEAIDASTALAWGLVNEVVEPSRLLPRAIAIAEAIIAGDELSQLSQLDLLRDADGRPVAEAIAAEADALAAWRVARAAAETS